MEAVEVDSASTTEPQTDASRSSPPAVIEINAQSSPLSEAPVPSEPSAEPVAAVESSASTSSSSPSPSTPLPAPAPAAPSPRPVGILTDTTPLPTAVPTANLLVEWAGRVRAVCARLDRTVFATVTHDRAAFERWREETLALLIAASQDLEKVSLRHDAEVRRLRQDGASKTETIRRQHAEVERLRAALLAAGPHRSADSADRSSTDAPEEVDEGEGVTEVEREEEGEEESEVVVAPSTRRLTFSPEARRKPGSASADRSSSPPSTAASSQSRVKGGTFGRAPRLVPHAHALPSTTKATTANSTTPAAAALLTATSASPPSSQPRGPTRTSVPRQPAASASPGLPVGASPPTAPGSHTRTRPSPLRSLAEDDAEAFRRRARARVFGPHPSLARTSPAPTPADATANRPLPSLPSLPSLHSDQPARRSAGVETGDASVGANAEISGAIGGDEGRLEAQLDGATSDSAMDQPLARESTAGPPASADSAATPVAPTPSEASIPAENISTPSSSSSSSSSSPAGPAVLAVQPLATTPTSTSRGTPRGSRSRGSSPIGIAATPSLAPSSGLAPRPALEASLSDLVHAALDSHPTSTRLRTTPSSHSVTGSRGGSRSSSMERVPSQRMTPQAPVSPTARASSTSPPATAPTMPNDTPTKIAVEPASSSASRAPPSSSPSSSLSSSSSSALVVPPGISAPGPARKREAGSSDAAPSTPGQRALRALAVASRSPGRLQELAERVKLPTIDRSPLYVSEVWRARRSEGAERAGSSGSSATAGGDPKSAAVSVSGRGPGRGRGGGSHGAPFVDPHAAFHGRRDGVTGYLLEDEWTAAHVWLPPGVEPEAEDRTLLLRPESRSGRGSSPSRSEPSPPKGTPRDESEAGVETVEGGGEAGQRREERTSPREDRPGMATPPPPPPPPPSSSSSWTRSRTTETEAAGAPVSRTDAGGDEAGDDPFALPLPDEPPPEDV